MANSGVIFFKPKSHILHFISKSLFAINEKKKKKGCEGEYHKFLHCAYWEDVISNINQIGLIAKKKIPILFLIHPVFEKDKDYRNYSLASLHKELTDVSTVAGLQTLDLLEVFKNYDPEELKQTGTPDWFDPWHPNAKGHRVIAHYLQQKLFDLNYWKDETNPTGNP